MTTQVIIGDCREALGSLPDASVNCCVTSPPYFGLRDYGVNGQIGLEQTPQAYVDELVFVFREVKRVLRDDGTLWLNLGDSYNAHPGQRKTTDAAGPKQMSNRGAPGAPSRHVSELKPKDLIGIPWRVAFALQTDGWYLRQDIIWNKPNPMPESVRDRCTKAHEYVFMLSKSARYLYDAEAISEEMVYSGLTGQDASGFKDPKAFNGKHARATGDVYSAQAFTSPQSAPRGPKSNFGDSNGRRNKRSVWTIATKPFADAHFATMAPELARTCILAGCPLGGTVLDPFGGAGTTGLVADQLQRNAVLIELNPSYADMARKRIDVDAGMFGEVA